MPTKSKTKTKKAVKKDSLKNKESFTYQVHDVFVGPHSVFSILAVVIGIVIMGNTFWQWSMFYLGDYYTFFLGMLLTLLGGFYLGFFRD